MKPKKKKKIEKNRKIKTQWILDTSAMQMHRTNAIDSFSLSKSMVYGVWLTLECVFIERPPKPS